MFSDTKSVKDGYFQIRKKITVEHCYVSINMFILPTHKSYINANCSPVFLLSRLINSEL